MSFDLTNIDKKNGFITRIAERYWKQYVIDMLNHYYENISDTKEQDLLDSMSEDDIEKVIDNLVSDLLYDDDIWWRIDDGFYCYLDRELKELNNDL